MDCFVGKVDHQDISLVLLIVTMTLGTRSRTSLCNTAPFTFSGTIFSTTHDPTTLFPLQNSADQDFKVHVCFLAGAIINRASNGTVSVDDCTRKISSEITEVRWRILHDIAVQFLLIVCKGKGRVLTTGSRSGGAIRTGHGASSSYTFLLALVTSDIGTPLRRPTAFIPYVFVIAGARRLFK